MDDRTVGPAKIQGSFPECEEEVGEAMRHQALEVMSGLGEGSRLPSLTALSPVFRWPVQVYAHAGATLEGKMYVTCGRRGEDYLKETHCYEPDSNTWHALADGPVRRAWHGMATLLDKLYVIGGSNNDAGYRRDVHQVSGARLLTYNNNPVPFSSY